uniref:Serine/threonine/tyrosine interacting-like 1 n=1 Tax=Scleropages formosus TaxID=113540 RepID=A0A8C9TTQ8_SCLFO
MSQIILCDATELYNILNQYFRVSRLVEFNYLCLIDARSQEEYNESHIITARKAKWDDEGKFVMPAGVEIESMRYCVVYDSNTSSLQGSGPATDCTGILAKSSRYPVQILKGGYERFSALYPFFRTQKILYTLKELESMKPYPVEILPGQLYMGDYRQATSPQIHKDLKLQAVVNVSEKTNHVILSCETFHVSGSHFSAGSAILIFSSDGISRCSTVSIAFLQYHLKFTLQEAWEHMLKCKSNMRPKRGFVQQLSDWEVHTLGERKTFIAEPHY